MIIHLIPQAVAVTNWVQIDPERGLLDPERGLLLLGILEEHARVLHHLLERARAHSAAAQRLL